MQFSSDSEDCKIEADLEAEVCNDDTINYCIERRVTIVQNCFRFNKSWI